KDENGDEPRARIDHVAGAEVPTADQMRMNYPRFMRPETKRALTRILEPHRPAASRQKVRKQRTYFHASSLVERILCPKLSVAERRFQCTSAATAWDGNQRAHCNVVVRRD